jgi:hypothetical protein
MNMDRYIMTGTLDKGPDALPPKGEFFTSQRNKFMPQIPGEWALMEVDKKQEKGTGEYADNCVDTFQKKEIQE